VTDQRREPEKSDPWGILENFLSPGTRRKDLLEELRENQSWIGTLKKVQVAIQEDPGLSASCRAFILFHLSEIERITEELRKNGNN